VARVGKTPGATASVNLYALFDARRDRDVLGLCDLPGFGYAKLSKEVQESVQVAAERYLSKRRQLALGILLVDIRRAPSDDDRAVLAALYDLGVPILVVATKVDKVDSDRRRQSCLEAIRSGLGLPPNQPLAVSSATGDGCRHLWRIVLEACENAVDEFGSKYEGDSDRRSEGRSPAGEADERSSYNHDLLLPDDGDEIVYDQGYDWIDEE
jgi:GTP-binding protein